MVVIVPMDYELTGVRFAFWNTVRNAFFVFNNESGWATEEDFVFDFLEDPMQIYYEIERFISKIGEIRNPSSEVI